MIDLHSLDRVIARRASPLEGRGVIVANRVSGRTGAVGVAGQGSWWPPPSGVGCNGVSGVRVVGRRMSIHPTGGGGAQRSTLTRKGESPRDHVA